MKGAGATPPPLYTRLAHLFPNNNPPAAAAAVAHLPLHGAYDADDHSQMGFSLPAAPLSTLALVDLHSQREAPGRIPILARIVHKPASVSDSHGAAALPACCYLAIRLPRHKTLQTAHPCLAFFRHSERRRESQIVHSRSAAPSAGDEWNNLKIQDLLLRRENRDGHSSPPIVRQKQVARTSSLHPGASPVHKLQLDCILPEPKLVDQGSLYTQFFKTELHGQPREKKHKNEDRERDRATDRNRNMTET